MPLFTFNPQQRRINVLERVASETYVDPSIAQAVSFDDRATQLDALRTSGASASELRVASQALQKKGGLGGMAFAAIVGSITSLVTGSTAVRQLKRSHPGFGLGWAAAALTAASLTASSVLNHRERRRLAPTLNEAASSMEAAYPTSPTLPYLRRS